MSILMIKLYVYKNVIKLLYIVNKYLQVTYKICNRITSTNILNLYT